MSLLSLVRRAIRRHALFGPDDGVAVALSGGSDSVALAWLVHEIAARGGCRFVGAIHVNHGLRGDASDGDEAFCLALAERLAVPFDSMRVDVAALARARHRSLEWAARDARDACFTQAAARLGASRVATGHTLDDQAETVLLRLLRGAGVRGLAAIRPRRGLIVRPLIDCRRADLGRYLADRGETSRHDASNDDRAIARNRIRHDLLPVVERVAPRGVQALARFAAQSRDLEAFLSRAARDAARTVVLPPEHGRARIDAAALAELPAVLARHLLLVLAEDVRPGVALSTRHLEALLSLAAADKQSGHLDLPGLTVERQGRVICLTPARPVNTSSTRGVVPEGEATRFERVLQVPGSVDVPEAGVTISAAAEDRIEPTPAGGRAVRVQAGSVRPPFTVRNRRIGDRLRPLGAPGRRKLQDLLVDRKVPRSERDRVPIVVDASGRIVWVAGLTIAEECRVTAPEAGVVILEMK
jgi:tRNA(Ile)-lysidine synthase